MIDQMSTDTFAYYLRSGAYARSARSVINRILEKKRQVSAIDNRLSVSGFPETNRFIWLMPAPDGEVAVIEAPPDDDSPYTILSALSSSDLWRWGRTVSKHYVDKVSALCRDNSIPLPTDQGAKSPLNFSFPPDWINSKGKRRIGMQVHCIVSTSAVQSTRRLDPPQAKGALCSCKSTAANRTPASRGCAFVSRASYYDGLTFADGLANAVFGDAARGSKQPESLFNFTDKQFNEEVYTKFEDRSILVLLYAFTMIIRTQVRESLYGRNIQSKAS